MSIIDYYKNKKKKNKLIQNINIPTFANERFWFLRKMPRNMLNFGPFVQRISKNKPRYNIDTTNVIGHSMYGKNFKKSQQAPTVFGKNGIEKLWKGVSNKHEILEHINYHKDNGKVLSLLDKGISFERLLGKEWDNDLSRSVVQQVQLSSEKYNGYFSRLNDAKRGLIVSKEDRMTPSDAIRYMQWERVVRDPSIINNLMTREQAQAQGYKFDDKNMPISIFVNANEQPLYDVPAMFDNTQLVPNYTMSKSINDVLRDVTPASLYVFGNQLAKATNVRVVSTKDMPKDEVEVKSRRISSIVKKAKNVVKRTLGRTESALNQAVTMQVSTEGTQAEKTYLLVRDIAVQSILPLIRETEKACVLNGETTKNDDAYIRFLSKFKLNIKPDNLPTYRELKDNEAIIMDVAGSLIASQVVKMGNLREKESRALSELYKVDAMQLLSQVKDKDNTWMMPLIASYVGLTLPKFAKDLKTDIKQYAELNDVQYVEGLTGAVFGKVSWDAGKGVITRDQVKPQIDPGAFDVVDDNYKPRVIDIKGMINSYKAEKSKEKIVEEYNGLCKMIVDLSESLSDVLAMGTTKEMRLETIKKGFSTYKQLQTRVADYNNIVAEHQEKFNESQTLPEIRAFDEALIEYYAEMLRCCNAMDHSNDTILRYAKVEYVANQVIKTARDEIFEELTKHGIDVSEITDIKTTLAELEEQGKNVDRLENICKILKDELIALDITEAFNKPELDATLEDLVVTWSNKVTHDEPEIFNMTNLWKEWINSAETEEQANKIIEKMRDWQDDLLVTLEKLEEAEKEYQYVRENVLNTEVITPEDVDKYKSMIEDIDVNRVKACYLLNDVNLFNNYAEKSDTIKNDTMYENNAEAVVMTRPVLTNWKNKCKMMLDELNYVSSINSENEEYNKAHYANSFANYIKNFRSLTKDFGDIDFQDEFTNMVNDEIRVYRSIYNRSVERTQAEEELTQIAEFYSELAKEYEQVVVSAQPKQEQKNERKLLSAKEKSALTR